MSAEALKLFQAYPFYFKPKTLILIPELVQKEVLEWLNSLDFSKRFEVFMINDYQITQAILQMTRKQALDSMNYFIRTHKETLKSM